MKYILYSLFILIGIFTNACNRADNGKIEDNSWQLTQPVDSKWAGIVQLKWNSKTGESQHLIGTESYVTDWPTVIKTLGWEKISSPENGWENAPEHTGRFMITNHVVFGRNAIQEATGLDLRRHAVFNVDTYTGRTYVLTMRNSETGVLNFPNGADGFKNLFWKVVEEANEKPMARSNQRYFLHATNSTYPLQGNLYGPFVSRIDTFTGEVNIATYKHLVCDSNDDTDMIFVSVPFNQAEFSCAP